MPWPLTSANSFRLWQEKQEIQPRHTACLKKTTLRGNWINQKKRTHHLNASMDPDIYFFFWEEPGFSFLIKLVVYNPSYKDKLERNGSYIQILVRIPGLPCRRRSEPSMKPTTTPTKEMKFERHHEQHIREPMHLEDDERTGQERWPAAITSPKPGSLTPQTTTPARRTTRTPKGK